MNARRQIALVLALLLVGIGMVVFVILYRHAIADRDLLVLTIGLPPNQIADRMAGPTNQSSYRRAFYTFIADSKLSDANEVIMPAGTFFDEIRNEARSEAAREVSKLESLPPDEKKRAFFILQESTMRLRLSEPE